MNYGNAFQNMFIMPSFWLKEEIHSERLFVCQIKFKT